MNCNVRVGLNLLQPFVEGMRVVQITTFAVAVTMYGTVTDIVMISAQTCEVHVFRRHQTCNVWRHMKEDLVTSSWCDITVTVSYKLTGVYQLKFLRSNQSYLFFFN